MANVQTDIVYLTIAGIDDVAFEVTFTYRPETPHVYYLRNGDPGYPGDPAELEIITVKHAKTGADVPDWLRAIFDTSDEVSDQLIERADGEARAEAEAAAEMRADCR
jgi:hypothetical protein